MTQAKPAVAAEKEQDHTKMQAAVLHQPGSFLLTAASLPEPGPDEVRFREIGRAHV